MTEKIKIAHVTFDMRIGGAERVIYSLASKSDNSKYDTMVVCIENTIGPFGEKLISKGIKVVSFNRKPGFDWSLTRAIYKFIKTNKISILHCHQYTPYVYGVLGALFTDCKVIFTEHGRFYPDQRKIKRMMVNPFLNLFTDEITVISKATGKALHQFENFPEKRIRVIYNGIEHQANNESVADIRVCHNISNSALVLGTIARLDTIKNQKMMIKILAELIKIYPDTILLLVGDGPERENLERDVKKLNLSNNVIFTGFKDNVQDYYHIMDVFMLISFSEGTSMTLLEAMASSLPCIVSDAGGNPEIIENNKSGFVIPCDDKNAMVAVLTALMENKSLKKKMGEASNERFLEKFSLEKMISGYEFLYEKLKVL